MLGTIDPAVFHKLAAGSHIQDPDRRLTDIPQPADFEHL